MKNKKTNKAPKRTKYAYGGTAMNTQSPQEMLFNMIKTSQDSQVEAATDPMVLGLQGVGAGLTSTGMSMGMQGIKDMGGLGSFLEQAKTMFAQGGSVGRGGIEVEGDEAFETPEGQFGTFKGPSHAQGGIPLGVKQKGAATNGELPEGTFIYPKKFKIKDAKTGKKESMADRAKRRENKEKKIADLLEGSADKILKDTLARTQANNTNQDIADKLLWHHNEMSKLKGNTQKFAGGGPVTDKTGTSFDTGLMDKFNLAQMLFGSMINPVTGLPTGIPIDSEAPTNPLGITSDSTSTAGATSKGLNFNTAGLPTAGDALGMAGNLFQAFMPLKNTLDQRKGDTANINPYDNYGDGAMDILKGNHELLGVVEDNQKQNAALNRNAAFNRNAGSARGLNTMRALNLATDAQHNELDRNISSDFAAKTMALQDKIAATSMDISGKKAQGEQYRDLSDRQDRDAFYTNLGQNYTNLGEGVSRTGKSLNDLKTRGTQANFMNMLSDLVQGNVMNGTITQKEGIMGNGTDVSTQFDSWLKTSFKPEVIAKMSQAQLESLKGVFLKQATGK